MHKRYNQILCEIRVEILEQFLKIINRAIHDNIGQVLSFIKLNLSAINALNTVSGQEKLNESKSLLGKSIRDLRSLTRNYLTDVLSDAGLAGAIEYQLQLFEKTGQYKTSFSLMGELFKIASPRELIVLRIVQQLLGYMDKNEEMNVVSIKMQYLEDKLIITAEDNGKGFDIEAIQFNEANKSRSFADMFSRMRLINGSLVFNSNPERGTNAVIELLK